MKRNSLSKNKNEPAAEIGVWGKEGEERYDTDSGRIAGSMRSH
jgi:hypothetical protein